MKILRTKAKRWSVDVTIGNKRVRESGFATKKAVEDFSVELKVQAKRGRFGLERTRPRLTLGELVTERISELDQSDRNKRRAAVVLRNFEKHFGTDYLIDDLKPADLRGYVKERQERALSKRGRRLSPGTINQDLTVISGMFTAAPELFAELGEDWRPPRIPWAKVAKRGRERIITREERETLLQGLRLRSVKGNGRRLAPAHIESRRDAADALDLSLQTGMRGGEVRRIKWVAVDFEIAEVHLPRTKNGEPRDVPLNGRALGILRRRFESRRSHVWVFPNKSGLSHVHDGQHRAMIRRVALELGLRYGQDLEDGFTVHTARHTAATEMIRARVDPSAVQKLLGHSHQTMTLRYTHADREGVRRAVETLDQSADSTFPRQKADKQKAGRPKTLTGTNK